MLSSTTNAECAGARVVAAVEPPATAEPVAVELASALEEAELHAVHVVSAKAAATTQRRRRRGREGTTTARTYAIDTERITVLGGR